MFGSTDGREVIMNFFSSVWREIRTVGTVRKTDR